MSVNMLDIMCKWCIKYNDKTVYLNDGVTEEEALEIVKNSVDGWEIINELIND